MDNTKTGLLIKELRKGKGMTQKELAEMLHITDRAVSKWERGLCAPDIALLEPLAGILGCSVLDLIAGERETQVERSEETEEGAKSIIVYSMNEIARKLKRTKKNCLRVTVLCMALLLVICVGIFWKNGYFFVVDKTTSPDETKKVTIYNKALEGAGFSLEDATSLILQKEDGAQTRIIYGDCVYRGLWWAPDSKKYNMRMDCILCWIGLNGIPAAICLLILPWGSARRSSLRKDMDTWMKAAGRKLPISFYNGAWIANPC